MSRPAPVSPPRIRVDFHAHTRLSPDAWQTPARLVERAREVGLDRIAVTDHGEIEGAFAAHALDPELVIVGEEIRCRCGTELIGLYLREHVPGGLSTEETAARIRAQGGVVYAPHPFAYPRDAVERARRALAVADVVEVVNSRAFRPAWNRLARRAAAERGLPVATGSDGHFAWEIGRCFTEMPAFGDAAGLRAALAETDPVSVEVASPWTLMASMALHVSRWAVGRLHGGRAMEPPWSFFQRVAPR